MSTTSDVSIIVNAYDEEPAMLAEALDSAIAQTVAPAEILLVDDGSARDYEGLFRAYPTVRVVRQANQGLAAARNTGLRCATGKHIVFLDGDDRLLPNALAHNLRRLAEHPEAAMAYGGYRFIDGNGRPSFQAAMRPMGKDAYAAMLEGNCVGMHAAVMYRRKALLEIGGFDVTLPACEDYDVYLRIARRHPIAAGSEVVAEYRQHEANMSRDAAMMLAAARRVLRAQTPYLGGHPAWRSAWEKGMRGWGEFYARGQLLALQRALVDGSRTGAALLGLARLALQAPAAICKVATMEISTRLRARLGHGRIDFGGLRRTTPISRHFGYDRGNPVDRHYVEDFLSRHSADIRGCVLEVGDDAYTRRFGGERVEKSEVLHVEPDAPGATYCADLADGAALPSDHFDCVVLTQTLQFVFDVAAATRTLRRILKPGGVLLVTVPGVSSVDTGKWGSTWYWSFTPAALERLLHLAFRAADVSVSAYGNVLTATAFLYGLAEDELRPHELGSCDPHYPVIVAARVVKTAR